jgi:ATP-dependent DNA helicase RecQ
MPVDQAPASARPTAAAPEAALRQLFGYPAFRPGQAEVVDAALAGRDTLALMPTGAGKSLCYQLPAMLLPGVTLVVSPLIALMKDQLDALPPAVAAHTALINSTLERAELAERLRRVAAGEVKLVYAAPERLRQQPFLHALRRAGLALFVVDEAHCALLWGSDFRPDYLFIPRALEALGDPPLLTLTATATPAMQAELRKVLRRDLAMVTTGVLRDNLFLAVQRAANDEQKLRALAELCQHERGAGIVYVASRERAEELARFLRRQGVLAQPYHAGLGRDERARVQDAFMRDRVRVVAATVAFGMGVDKSNVRFIAHYGLPRSLEAYAQESGRAGRDGEPARCVVLYSPSDKANLARWQREDALGLEDLRRVYRAVREAAGAPPRWGWLDPEALLAGLNDGEERRLSEVDLRVALSVLEQAGLLERGFDAPRTGVVELRGSWADSSDAGRGSLVTVDLSQPAAVVELLERAGTSPAPTDGPTGGPVLPLPLRGVARGEEVAAAERGDATPATGRGGADAEAAPDTLERRLLEAEDAGLLRWRPGPRAPLVRLREPPPDAAERMQTLLRRAGREDEAEVRRVVEYVEGRGCRLRALAAHFGVRLFDACGRCDVCAGEATALGTSGAESRLRADPAALADPAETIRACLQGLPFPVGKKGLVRVLTGSVASPIKRDRCPQYGALAGVVPTALERVLDQLLADGYLQRGGDEFGSLQLAARWAGSDAPSIPPLTPKAPPAPKASPAGSRPHAPRTTAPADGANGAAGYASAPSETELSPEARARFERLRAWRTARARADQVPPYVICNDATLRALAHQTPSDEQELLAVPGIGPAKVERYGAELLELLSAT